MLSQTNASADEIENIAYCIAVVFLSGILRRQNGRLCGEEGYRCELCAKLDWFGIGSSECVGS
jgi:hypothetical protein